MFRWAPSCPGASTRRRWSRRWPRLRRRRSRPSRCFTSDGYNELPRARRIAELFSTDHRELVVEPKGIEILPAIVRHYGEPFADASAIPSFYLARMAADHVTVALNGDGGDESSRATPATSPTWPSRVSTPCRAHCAAEWRGSASGCLRTGASTPGRAASGGWRLSAELDAPQRYVAYMTRLNGLDREALYTDEARELTADHDIDAVMLAP